MDYLVDGHTYTLSYTELRDKYDELRELSDEEFVRRLPEVLHVVCIVSYVKETPAYILLNDLGLIHMISHLLHIPHETKHELPQIREQFNLWCKLV